MRVHPFGSWLPSVHAPSVSPLIEVTAPEEPTTDGADGVETSNMVSPRLMSTTTDGPMCLALEAILVTICPRLA